MRVDAIDSLMPAAFSAGTAGALRPAAAAAVAQPVARHALAEAVTTANRIAARSGSEVEFRMDDDNRATIVRIVDRRTKEVIHQFPSEDMLSLRRALETLRGLLLDQRV